MITSNQIRLRAVERSDLPRFVEWLNDPEVISGLTLYLPMSMAQEEQWFENLSKRPIDEHPMLIEVKTGEGWQAIGNCGFHEIDRRVRSSEVGIFIGEKQMWNQGYGSQAMQLLLRHGFATLNLHRIMLRVHEDNPRAIRSYEKVGFVHEGRFRHAEYKDGRYVDVFFMSVLEDEWRQRQAENEEAAGAGTSGS